MDFLIVQTIHSVLPVDMGSYTGAGFHSLPYYCRKLTRDNEVKRPEFSLNTVLGCPKGWTTYFSKIFRTVFAVSSGVTFNISQPIRFSTQMRS